MTVGLTKKLYHYGGMRLYKLLYSLLRPLSSNACNDCVLGQKNQFSILHQ